MAFASCATLVEGMLLRIRTVARSILKRAAIVTLLATCVAALPVVSPKSPWALEVLGFAFRPVEPVDTFLFGLDADSALPIPGGAIAFELIKLVLLAIVVYVPMSYAPELLILFARLTRQAAYRATTDRPEIVLSALVGAGLGGLAAGFAWGATHTRIGPFSAIGVGAAAAAWLAGVLHCRLWDLVSRKRTVSRT